MASFGSGAEKTALPATSTSVSYTHLDVYKRQLQAIAAYLDRHSMEAMHTSTQIIIAQGYEYKIVVGRDARSSGEMVKNVVVGTLMGMGLSLIHI